MHPKSVSSRDALAARSSLAARFDVGRRSWASRVRTDACPGRSSTARSSSASSAHKKRKCGSSNTRARNRTHAERTLAVSCSRSASHGSDRLPDVVVSTQLRV
jgi:hypothetical protein